jgi:cytochrome c oxidase subunit 3
VSTATAVADHAAHHHTSTGLDSRKIGLWAFIGSECMLFGSLIATYLAYKGKSIVGPLPHEPWTNPQTGETFPAILDIPVTSASTFVLLMSSLAMVLAHNAVVNRHKPKVTRTDRIIGNSSLWLFMTALLGLVFLCFQAYEFTAFVNEGLKIGTNLFGSSFFTLTGFHGAHVSVGVMWLVALLFIDRKRTLGPEDATNVDLCALYWHFVDVVWIAIFTLLYLIK